MLLLKIDNSLAGLSLAFFFELAGLSPAGFVRDNDLAQVVEDLVNLIGALGEVMVSLAPSDHLSAFEGAGNFLHLEMVCLMVVHKFEIGHWLASAGAAYFVALNFGIVQQCQDVPFNSCGIERTGTTFGTFLEVVSEEANRAKHDLAG